jgi:hypothetical protein
MFEDEPINLVTLTIGRLLQRWNLDILVNKLQLLRHNLNHNEHLPQLAAADFVPFAQRAYASFET